MLMGLSFMFPSLTSLSIPCLVFSGLCYGLGVGPVSFVLMSSLYPQKMKSAGVAVSQTCRALIVLIQLKSFPYLMEVMDLSGIFFIASICSILGAAFSLVFIPETRNKSISELENLFVRHVKPSVQTKA